jgi:hypothetical protein
MPTDPLTGEELLTMRAGLDELISDIIWPHFALTVIGAIVVVAGTLLPYDQLVFAQAKLPISVQNHTDWSGPFRLSLTHYPGLVITIAALLTVVFEARVQQRFAETQRGFRQWKLGFLGLEFMTVIAMALLVLFSWPVTGQGFAVDGQGLPIGGQGVGSAHAISNQLVVLRGPGAIMSFIGIALCLYEISRQAAAFWRIRLPIHSGEHVRTVVKI